MSIGGLDWYDCQNCKEYRTEGGCNPLDEMGDAILRIDFENETVECERYVEKGQ
jgi:hypothetical protein